MSKSGKTKYPTFGGAALALLAAAAIWSPGGEAIAADVTVYKSPTCGCCKAWVDHLRANGFNVTAKDMSDMDQVKAKLGVPPKLSSCHTATVNGYVIEGHVPAADIKRLLAEKPKVSGLTAPGMPMGSPGMEGPHKDSYDVLAFDTKGETRVYAHHD